MKTALIAGATVFGIMLAALCLVMVAGMTPCVHEDSKNCYWDGSTRGNGQGTSFIDLGGYALIIPAL